MSSNENEAAGSGNNNLIRGIIAVALAFTAILLPQPIARYIKNTFSIDPLLIKLCIRALIALIPFLILGGKRWLKFSTVSVKETFRVTKLMLILPLISLLGLAASLLSYILKNGFDMGVLGRLGYSVVLAGMIGINEEMMFRALLFCGLLLILGKKKNGMMIAVIIAGFVFGFAHVYEDIDFSSAASVISSVMKTLQCGIFAFVLCYCCVKFDNLWGAIIFHAVNDWLLLSQKMVFSSTVSVDYVSTDTKELIKAVAMYTIMILLTIPAAKQGYKYFKQLGPTEGVLSGEEPPTVPAEETAGS